MRILMLAIVAALAVGAQAETYRLKYVTTVDVLDDSGKKIGTKKLKAKTVIQEVAAEEAAPQAGGKLVPGDMSPAVLIQTAPATAVIRAEVRLYDFYASEFKKDKYWSIYCYGMNDDWSLGELFYAYVRKSTALGKRVFDFVKDGKEHKCIVKLHHRGNKMATIEDIEPYAGGE